MITGEIVNSSLGAWFALRAISYISLVEGTLCMKHVRNARIAYRIIRVRRENMYICLLAEYKVPFFNSIYLEYTSKIRHCREKKGWKKECTVSKGRDDLLKWSRKFKANSNVLSIQSQISRKLSISSRQPRYLCTNDVWNGSDQAHGVTSAMGSKSADRFAKLWKIQSPFALASDQMRLLSGQTVPGELE